MNEKLKFGEELLILNVTKISNDNQNNWFLIEAVNESGLQTKIIYTKNDKRLYIASSQPGISIDLHIDHKFIIDIYNLMDFLLKNNFIQQKIIDTKKTEVLNDGFCEPGN